MSEPKRNDQELRRFEELEHLESIGINPYPYFYNITATTSDIKQNFKDTGEEHSEKGEQYNVSVAGRIMALRRMGEASFF